MAKNSLDCSGCDQVIQMLQGVAQGTEAICSMALYEGAGVVAEAVQSAIDALPSEAFHPLPGSSNGTSPLNVVTEDDRADLKGGVAIAPFEHTGFGVGTAVSIGGYSRHASRKFPRGIPLPLIARSIEGGSSARRGHRFIRSAVRARRNDALQAMEQSVASAVEALGATGMLPAAGGRGISRVTR